MPSHWNPRTDYRFVNWGKNQHADPSAYHQPRSEREVVDLVESVRKRGETMRVVGAGHSWSDVAVCEDNLVNLDRMNRVLSIDTDRRRVTVQAGIRLEDLVSAMAVEGLAAHNLGSIMKQSIAGATSTGTHGSGLGLQNLSQMIVGMRLVTGTGEVLELDEDDDRLEAARLSLGCLGVITQVTLQAVPLYDLEERTWSLPFDWAVKAAPRLAESNDWCKFWWLPHTGKVQVYTYRRTTADRTPTAPLGESADRILNDYVFAAILGIGTASPPLVPPLNRLVHSVYFKRGRRVGSYEKMLTLAMPPSHLEIEWGVPYEATQEMMRRVKELVDRQNIRVSFINEVRFVAADETWLSNSYRRDTCQFGAYTARGGDAQRFFAGVGRISEELGGRPHWGKDFDVPANRLRDMYPRYDDFVALCRQLDPDGVFENDFVRRSFRR